MGYINKSAKERKGILGESQRFDRIYFELRDILQQSTNFGRSVTSTITCDLFEDFVVKHGGRQYHSVLADDDVADARKRMPLATNTILHIPNIHDWDYAIALMCRARFDGKHWIAEFTSGRDLLRTMRLAKREFNTWEAQRATDAFYRLEQLRIAFHNTHWDEGKRERTKGNVAFRVVRKAWLKKRKDGKWRIKAWLDRRFVEEHRDGLTGEMHVGTYYALSPFAKGLYLYLEGQTAKTSSCHTGLPELLEHIGVDDGRVLGPPNKQLARIRRALMEINDVCEANGHKRSQRFLAGKHDLYKRNMNPKDRHTSFIG